jgi:regulatory protein
MVRSVSPARRGWVRVETGRESWLITSRDAEILGLAEGSEVDGELLRRSALEAQAPAARKDTGRYLARSEHTADQLKRYLRRRGYAPQVVDDTVTWAVRLGYVDDLRYAMTFVRSHRSGKSPMGRRRLRAELRRRGVADGDAREALSDLDDGDMEEGLVARVEKRYGRLAPEVGRRRAMGYLSRRGFSADMARRVVDRALGEGGRS